MKYYFNEITWNDSPVIWNTEPDSMFASCDYNTLANNLDLDRSQLNGYLATFPGIFIDDNIAYINSLSSFKFQPISLLQTKPTSTMTDAPLLFKRNSNPLKLSETMRKDLPKLPDPHLEVILMGHHGNTIAYLKLQENRIKFLHDIQKLHLLNSNKLYSLRAESYTLILGHIRQSQMQIIHSLFDEFLSPALRKATNDQKDNKELEEFFQSAILNVMNFAFNKQKTVYETVETNPSPELVIQHRKNRLALMMTFFNFFINEMPVESLSMNLSEKQALLLFKMKAALLDQKPKMKEKLDQLALLTLYSGIYSQQYDSMVFAILNGSETVDLAAHKKAIRERLTGNEMLDVLYKQLQSKGLLGDTLLKPIPEMKYIPFADLVTKMFEEAKLGKPSKEVINRIQDNLIKIVLEYSPSSLEGSIIQQDIKSQDMLYVDDYFYQKCLASKWVAPTEIPKSSAKSFIAPNPSLSPVKLSLIDQPDSLIDHLLNCFKLAALEGHALPPSTNYVKGM
jgi:hypothetical protein